MALILNLLTFQFLGVLFGCVKSKECTNIPTELSSHTFRYELLSSTNETRKEEVFSHYHVTPTDDSAWSSLLPRNILNEAEVEFNWMMMYRKMKRNVGIKPQQGVGDDFLGEVSLNNVRLDPNSMHGRAQQTNLEYLLMLDVDSLVWSFRKTAGMETPGQPYGGWEAPTVELRGHFVGHYLSASAQMWASTHNQTLKEKMSILVTALAACQKKMGTGYLSAFPSEFFDRLEAIKHVWAPYYTIHKILAGLLDQYVLADNAQALNMTTWMVDYFYNRVRNVIIKYTIERHWLSLNEEFGGMNDVLYKLYRITGDQKHLLLAHLFDKPCFLGPLAVKADDISGFHANTHIPIVVGSQMRYEVTGDLLYKEIGEFFMDIVNSSHSYATGGTSVDEFWSDPKRLASTLGTENEESCTTYNMLKVSRHLFRWTKEMAYADYYERALTNGVLSIQRGEEPGVMIYMLPLKPGGSKARSFHKWGTKFDSFWCCYGTGIESFSKLGDSIYFEENGKSAGLYIVQYISSSLDWELGQILVDLKVEPVVSRDARLQLTVAISKKQKTSGLSSTLNLRIPSWAYLDGAKANINGQDLSVPAAGSFLSITRSWSSGDRINLEIPLSLRLEAIKDDRKEYASIQAILYGPYLLAGLSTGEWDIRTGSASSPQDWITPIPADYNSHLVSLVQESAGPNLVLTNSNQSIKMENAPQPGTDSALGATFRLINLKEQSQGDASGKLVMLELFDFPGMVVVHKGKDKDLAVADVSSANSSGVFRLIAGQDGENGTVLLESESLKGCFVYSNSTENSASVQLRCVADTSDSAFKKGASFKLEKGLAEYHPISFVAKGTSRNFLLLPLLSLRDESYTVYFNIQS